jgi:restriction system protein
MAVPDFQTLMRPILEALEDGQPQSTKSIREYLVGQFALTPEDLIEKIPSGKAKTFQNRVGWALTYLLRAGLLSRPKRSIYQLTDRGNEMLEANPNSIGISDLKQFEEFQAFHTAAKQPGSGPDQAASTNGSAQPSTQTPEEQIESAYNELRATLIADLLDRILEQTPEFFEGLVLDVLQEMGYGGKVGSPVHHLGQTGDEGVDGVIREDELGLDLIYVQAKRWTHTVGRPEIQKFFGALHGKRATKGVFITTSDYSGEAKAYAEGVSPRIVLVDGNELARLMIDYGVGTTTITDRYVLKRVDLDYFASEDEDVPSPSATAPVSKLEPSVESPG